MKLVNRALSVLSIFLIITFCNCSSNDPAASASITLSIDGTTKSATFTAAQLIVKTTGEKERAISINAAAGSDMLILSVSSWGYQNPPTDGLLIKTYYSLFDDAGRAKATCLQKGITSYCDSNLITYLSGTNYYSSGFYTGAAYESIIKITANDPAKKTISGEYDAKVQSSTGTVLTLKGKFTNVSYFVTTQ
ncbi:MAG: hypothetical protein HOP30_05000 [Cyclobacteriaceae bacterium]|nr:hypothetical protein [Cyclobacteriaceae bacterium]